MFLTRESIDHLRDMRVCDIVDGSSITDSFFSTETLAALEFLLELLVEQLNARPWMFRIVPRYDKQIIIEFVVEPVLIINENGHMIRYATWKKDTNNAT